MTRTGLMLRVVAVELFFTGGWSFPFESVRIAPRAVTDNSAFGSIERLRPPRQFAGERAEPG